MPKPKVEVITEEGLGRFREEHLNPTAMLETVERHVRVLLRLPVGVGKSHAAAEFVCASKTRERFDLVLYAAPAWNILEEVIARLDQRGVPFRALRSRPSALCGALDPEWRPLEAQGCHALAKASLCETKCPQRARCSWVDQYRELEDVPLILLTDQRIGLMRSIVPLLMMLTKAKRVLIILDEARLLDLDLRLSVPRSEIERFHEVLGSVESTSDAFNAAKQEWRATLERLLTAGTGSLRTTNWSLPDALHEKAARIQEAGVARFGPDFRYSAYDLSQLTFARPDERWAESDRINFVARPFLHRHLLMLSAHVRADYAAHRLGVDSVASPFEDFMFTHTGSRVINVRRPGGADCYFKRDPNDVLATFAVLLLRNILASRSTLVIARKKNKKRVAENLRERLHRWGFDVEFVTEDFDRLPGSPNPRIIPVIHYGVLGVNDFSDYESAVCVNSYYINSRELNRAVQEFEGRTFVHKLDIARGRSMRRHAVLAEDAGSDEGRRWLGNVYLRKLEVDPVIQACGRVRFLTKPREVVFFQMNDLEREIGPVEDVPSLPALRKLLELPSAREVDESIQTQRVHALLDSGMTIAAVAAELGVSTRTVDRRRASAEYAKTPFLVIKGVLAYLVRTAYGLEGVQ